MENEYIGKVKINYMNYGGEDLYSDGAVEDELLSIVKDGREEDYDRIITEKNFWPITYHLSHIRQNILEWYPFDKGGRALEIGAGCGAITGVLARGCESVTCVDLSRKRSMINAYRNRDYGNIEIRVGNFQDVEPGLPDHYKYITLIGVLEYGASYIQGERPYEEFLRIVRRHLAPNGKLFIAIENKYGLKYWAGCKEDHVSRYYEGIEGYTHTTDVRTFSKKGLQEMLEETGYSNVTFYYPYPDYKLPMTIYSDKRLPHPGELVRNGVHLDNDRLVTFDERKVFDSLAEDGMFPEFSNSFLVVAEAKES